MILCAANIYSKVNDTLNLGIDPAAVVINEKEGLLRGQVSTGLIPHFGIHADLKLNTWMHSIEVGYGSGQIYFANTFPSDAYKFHYAYSFLYALGSIGKTNLYCYLGSKISGNHSVYDYHQINGMNIYWFTHYDLSLKGQLQWRINTRNSFHLCLDFPIISFLSRPPETFETLYNVEADLKTVFPEINKNLQFTSLNHLRCFYSGLNYQLQLSNHFYEKMQIEVSYEKTDIPKEITVLNYSLQLSLIYQFKGK